MRIYFLPRDPFLPKTGNEMELKEKKELTLRLTFSVSVSSEPKKYRDRKVFGRRRRLNIFLDIKSNSIQMSTLAPLSLSLSLSLTHSLSLSLPHSLFGPVHI